MFVISFIFILIFNFCDLFYDFLREREAETERRRELLWVEIVWKDLEEYKEYEQNLIYVNINKIHERIAVFTKGLMLSSNPQALLHSITRTIDMCHSIQDQKLFFAVNHVKFH